MCKIQCIYCRKMYNKVKNKGKCHDCENQFNSIFNLVTRQHTVTSKNLAEK